MKVKQLSLFELKIKKGRYAYSGTCIHYDKKELKRLVENGCSLDKWAKWYYRRDKYKNIINGMDYRKLGGNFISICDSSPGGESNNIDI